jgi:hypothetical protein
MAATGKGLVKATDAEEQRCAVGYEGHRTMPAVSKEFMKQARSYAQLHRYCQDSYGNKDEEFVAYVNQAQVVLRLKASQVDVPYEVGSRAVCCKKLPTGMTRLKFFQTVTEANDKARPLLLQQSKYLQDRLLRVRDSFSLCTGQGGCYMIGDVEASTLLRGFRILEIVTLNHIAHIGQCVSNEVFDPLSGCMNLSALNAYLKQNQQMIDRAFNAIESILYRIEKNEAISKRLGARPVPLSAKVAKRLKDAGQNLYNVAAFISKHNFTILVGTVMTIGAAPYLSPVLHAAGVAFSAKGTDVAVSTLVRELSYVFCRLASSPAVMGLVISAMMYAIVNSNWFIGILTASLSGAAFASLIGASIATGGVGGAFGAALILYMKNHGIKWEDVIRGFFQNKFVTTGIIVVPQLIMQYVGFVISTALKVACTVNNVATSTLSIVQNAGTTVVDWAQWLVGYIVPGTAEVIPITGGEKIAGATLEALSGILKGVEGNTVGFAVALQKVADLLNLYPIVSTGGAFFGSLLAYVFTNKNQELEEVNRLHNYSYELKDFIVSETLMNQTSITALRQELAGQQSALSEYDQGRLSHNAVVSTVTEQLEALADTVVPANFAVLVERERPTPKETVALEAKKDIPVLDAPKDSLQELSTAIDSFAEIEKVVEATRKAKEELENTKKDLIEAAEKADNPVEAKIYDDETSKIVDMQQEISTTPLKPVKVQVSILVPLKATVVEQKPITLTAYSTKPVEAHVVAAPPKPQGTFYGTKERQLPPPPPPSPQLLAQRKDAGVTAEKPATLPPPPPFTVPVAIAAKDVATVQEETGASMAFTNSNGMIEMIVDQKSGDLHVVSPPLTPPPAGKDFRLPTAQASKSLLDAIRIGATLKPANREQLKKGLADASRFTPINETNNFDVQTVLMNALMTKFRNVSSKVTDESVDDFE